MVFTGSTIAISLDMAETVDADTANILYRKPDGTVSFWPAVIEPNALVYQTTSTDLDQDGTW